MAEQTHPEGAHHARKEAPRAKFSKLVRVLECWNHPPSRGSAPKEGREGSRGGEECG
jgi:hypothetical protein